MEFVDIMVWTKYLNLGLILVLVQVSCIVTESVGITVGKPLLTPLSAKEVDKDHPQNHHEKVTSDPRLQHGSTSSTDDVVLKGNAPNIYNASNFVSTDGAKKHDGVEFAPDEEVLSPSTLTEQLYSQLENQEVKMAGFHVEKDPSGNEILSGPMEQSTANNNNDTFEYRTKGQTASSGGDEQQQSPGVDEKFKSSPNEEKIFSDPLAKVSYVLNQGGFDSHHHEMQTSQNEKSTSINTNKNSVDTKKIETGNQTENDVIYHGLYKEKVKSNNDSFVPGSITDDVSVPSRDPSAVKPLSSETVNHAKPTLHQGEMNRENFNQSVTSQKARLVTSPQALNSQLPELVQNVVESLGRKGSNFVSEELVKHPMVKNVWANAIAQALIKESDKISHIDSDRKSVNNSSTESDSEGITDSLHDHYINVQAESTAKPSYESADGSLTINKTKESTHVAEERLKDESKTRPSNGGAGNPLTLNQIQDPVHTLEDKLETESKPQAGNRTTDSPLMSNPMKDLGHMRVNNATSAPHVHEISRVGNEVNKTISGPSLEGNLNIANHNVQNGASANKGGQSEAITRPFNQANREDSYVQGLVNSQPYFALKNAERLRGDYNSKGSKQDVLGNKPALAPVINGFISSKEIPPTQFEGILGKAQTFRNEPIIAPYVNEFGSPKMSPTRSAGIHEGQSSGNNPNSSPPVKGTLSEQSSDRVIDAPFLYRNYTKLDPDESKYIQLNLMNDPVAKEGFGDSSGPYLSQQQLQDEDAREASYLEHQINSAGSIAREILPSLNASMPKKDNNEASYISGQIFGDPFAKVELAESYAGNNNLINSENKANSQIMASVFNEDKEASNSEQQAINSKPRQLLYPIAPHSYVTEETGSYPKPRSPYNNEIISRGTTKSQISNAGRMLLSSKTLKDISTVDLAPISNLERLQSAFNLNTPKTFMYTQQNNKNDQTRYMTEGKVPNDKTQNSRYTANSLPARAVRPQKKQLIQLSRTKLKRKRLRKAADDISSTPGVPISPVRSQKDQKASYKLSTVRNRPTKPRDQPGTRESEISPTSVIFGLTSNEMKELEQHLAHMPHGSGAIRDSVSVQEVSDATKGYYNTMTEDKPSAGTLIGRILKRPKMDIKGVSAKSQRAHTLPHKRKHIKLSPYRFSKNINRNKKTNRGVINKRDLESWEKSTDILNSDLDQLRDLSPKAQEDISNVIMKDYEGQQRQVKGMETFPFDERDPGYAFERSLKNQDKEQAKEKIDRKDFKSKTGERRSLEVSKGIRQNHRNVDTELHRKTEFSYDEPSKNPGMNKPVLKKGNKILNGDVIPLDDVRNDLAQGLLLETMRQESEGDLKYVKDVQKHDINRMKNMFQSAGVEIGIKRNSKTSLRPTKGKHGKVEKRDISDWNTEFNDGTFRSPDFERQLSKALKAESENDLTYMKAVQDMDEEGFGLLRHHPGVDYRSAIIQNNLHQRRAPKSSDSVPKESLANTQEKLRAFLKNSKSSDEVDLDEKHEGSEKGKWTSSAIQDSVFRDLTPDGKVLSMDYKDLGNFGADAQTQLASVLQSVNNGDQRDLTELEKMDSNDEKDVENIFTSSSETLKRSIAETPIMKKEGTIETIADVPDQKDINIVVSADEEEAGWSAWSKCTKSCGNGSTKTRSLYCNKSSPVDTFVKCPGWNHQTVPCDVPKSCPVNGGFTQWTQWSICSESCGPKAVRMRMRLCTNPPPAYGGKDCAGWRFQVEFCKSKECPHRPGVPPLETSKINKQIVFKTLSATPVIEEISSRVPSSAAYTSNTARTISRYSGQANIDQEMTHIPSLKSLLDIQQQGNVRQMPNDGPNAFGFQEIPNLRQFAVTPQALNTQSQQVMSSMQFLKPDMGSMPQSAPYERYENGGKNIHVQGRNDNIGFTPWSEWTGCSSSCGRGVKTRSRLCVSAFNAMGIDNSCLGPKVQTRRCRVRRCPVDGQFSPWSDWSECSKTCGAHSYQKRERTCTNPPPRYGGEECEGKSVERRHCSKPSCLSDLAAFNMSKVFVQDLKFIGNDSSNSTDGFTEWGPWSQCSQTCGSNLLRVRKRSCYKQNNQTCSGSTSEVKPCILPPCRKEIISDFGAETAIPSATSHNISMKNEFDWSPWSACTKTCGFGSYRTRERTCSLSIPEDLRKVCIGSDIQKVPCNVPMCLKAANTTMQQGNATKTIAIQTLPSKSTSGPMNQSHTATKLTNQTSVSTPIAQSNASAPVKLFSSPVLSDPNYSDWSPWSKCSATCGPRAVMYRERSCKLIGGKNCQGPNIQTKPCQFVRCPVHGGFSAWSQWSRCPVTCGTKALRRRDRTCTNPKPMSGGRDCEGERVQFSNCGTEDCPVDGGLTGWTAWSACTKTCHTSSVSVRERYCTNPPPQGKGNDCVGQRMQARACASSKCPVDGGVSEWSSWSVCRHCGRGQRKRTRTCTNPPAANGGKPCAAPLVHLQRCSVRHCKSSQGFGQWSSFSRCSRSCDGGIKTRRRRCRRPYKGCYGSRIQKRRCNNHRCPNGNYLVRADPVELCGYHPCKVAKCVTSPSAMCVSNSKCKPVFFDKDGRIISSCKGDSIVLSVPPERVCRFNPCEKSACFTSQAGRCAVSYGCKPIFIGMDGRNINCRGILTVSPIEACGFNPCFEKACKVDLTARCVTDSQCRPAFISKTQRILDECVEDDNDSDSTEEEDKEDKNTDQDELDVEDVSKTDSNDNDDDDDDDDDNDDDDENDNDDDVDEKNTVKRRKHKNRKSHKKGKDADDDNTKEGNDDDDDDDEDDDDDDDNDDKDSSNSKKKNVTPVVSLSDESSQGMASGMGSEIAFVSKHGPAKFYWLKGGDKGSKNKTEMLVIEATGSRKSSVLNPPRENRLKTKETSKIQLKNNGTMHHLQDKDVTN